MTYSGLTLLLVSFIKIGTLKIVALMLYMTYLVDRDSC